MSKRATTVPLAELMGGKGKASKVPKVEKAPPSTTSPSAEPEGELMGDLEAIDAVQAELLQVEDQQAKEIMEVIARYNKEKKQPIYKKREEIIAKVPDFWFKVLLAHPEVGPNISDLDQGVLSYLKSFHVAEHLDGSEQDYRVTFVFTDNPYFENTEVWKEFRFNDDDAEITASKIKWKDTAASKAIQDTMVTKLLDMKGGVPDDVQPTFFSIFDAKDRDFKMGDSLRGEIWQSPLEIYMSADFSEEEGEEEGEEGEGEEEEEEEAEAANPNEQED